MMRTAALMIVCVSLASCVRETDSQLHRSVAAHDAVLQELPRDFYRPGLGDLMNSPQLRHAKLWFAATASNWELAAFELEELQENFDRVSRWHAMVEGVPAAPAIKSFTQQGRYAIDQSIRRRDGVQFRDAFDSFTQGCNGCHRATGHPFIVIQRPSHDAIGNQTWSVTAE